MSITVHFHAAAGGGSATGEQAAARLVDSSTAKGMDGGASVPAADSDGMTHVDSPASATNAGGPPADLVRMVEAAFGRSGGANPQDGADTTDGQRGNDAGAAPQGA